MKKAVITLEVTLDEKNVPLDIQWHSTDAKNQEKIPCKSMFVSLWDPEQKNTLKIDLWTKDMPVGDMKQFFYETLVSMAETFKKATGEENIAEDLKDYCAHFAEKMELIQGPTQ